MPPKNALSLFPTKNIFPLPPHLPFDPFPHNNKIIPTITKIKVIVLENHCNNIVSFFIGLFILKQLGLSSSSLILSACINFEIFNLDYFILSFTISVGSPASIWCSANHNLNLFRVQMSWLWFWRSGGGL